VPQGGGGDVRPAALDVLYNNTRHGIRKDDGFMFHSELAEAGDGQSVRNTETDLKAADAEKNAARVKELVACWGLFRDTHLNH
jgi:hypothetical protein